MRFQKNKNIHKKMIKKVWKNGCEERKKKSTCETHYWEGEEG